MEEQAKRSPGGKLALGRCMLFADIVSGSLCVTGG